MNVNVYNALVSGYRGHTHLYKFPLGGDPGRPRAHWRDHVSRRALEHLGILAEGLEERGGGEVWAFLMFMLPP